MIWMIIGGVVLVVLFVIIAYYENKGYSPEGEVLYANRLDQMKEDARIRRLIDDEAKKMMWYYLLEHPKGNGLGIFTYYYEVSRVVVNYKVFDDYTAEFKGVNVHQLITSRFYELTK